MELVIEIKNNMKIALIGATGFVGAEVLKEALDRKHTVLAIARDTSKIEINSNLLIKKAVDVKNVDELSQAVAGSDVVISAFNPGWTNPNIYEEFLEGSKAIEQAVKNSRSEEHTSELQSREKLVCRLLLEKKRT